ncbi:MAG TPA: bifunctional UDP-N-acetylmuramoyl-tripeptide:D-alanyl-D-alanine ligase/alanine racemase, partial [Chitinophagaceae bacterium]|nr:bifunctional UDP-N-acetylmuramoyl-tripeptide:D-alanyl-D-alanine ligase/alanine racemase [Chitinophagaceae bacterium]
IIETENTVASQRSIGQLLLDSRKVNAAASSLFFALKGPRRDGHQFIPELYRKGVRSFVVSEAVDTGSFPEADFLQVYDTLVALQSLTAYHRQQFNIPVIGITGSNGKTIVKEWLYQLLSDEYNIVRSPKSYNSQIGVPLSVWPLNAQHTLGIFEAGISEQGEMRRLGRIIQPTIGVLTNIGDAHSDGFIDEEHKFREKLILFRGSKVVIGRDSDFRERKGILDMLGEDIQLKTWGYDEGNEFRVLNIDRNNDETSIELEFDHLTERFLIPFSDDASVENAITCYCVLKELAVAPVNIAARMRKLHPVNMRLELKKGINQCTVINDSYSADTNSLEIALNFLEQQSLGLKKTVILSDLLHSSLPDEELYGQVMEKLLKHKVNRIIGIGEKISLYLSFLIAEHDEKLETAFYLSSAEFTDSFLSSQFKEEAILVKGARTFEFEKIVQLLEQKAHQTLLEINLSAIAHNLKEYQKQLKPSTKVMAMVKAFAYGSGGAEIAGILQYHKVDYLGVAYADEGVELRKAGIQLPIMVMNPDETSFEKIIEHHLEPELYSFALLTSFDKFLRQEGLTQYPVHIEIETGMNRLGFGVHEMEELSATLSGISTFTLRSVFSHLAASEEAANDSFTLQQYDLFEKAAKELEQGTGLSFFRHIANSAAAIRHPQMQLDMVRLGIGLYGVDSSNANKLGLQTVATLKSTISQVKHIKAGESVSYNRRAVVARDSVIATVRIGYADGYPRRLGNGIGKVWVKGKMVPVIGTVCMDMFMVDVTDLPGIEEGAEVIIFGKQLPVQQLAEWATTIPYEIMTGISQRVKRVYYEE